MKKFAATVLFMSLVSVKVFSQTTGGVKFTDGCTGLSGAEFASVNDQMVGETLNGTKYGKWKLKFDVPSKGRLTYGFSDVVVVGFYSCLGTEGILSFTVNQDRPFTVTGAYNQETGLVLWNGLWFKKLVDPRQGEKK